MLWNTVYYRCHRYDVRAADRKAVQVEQRLMRSYCKATVAAPTNVDIRRQNFNETKVLSKQKAKKTKIPSTN